MLRNLTIIAIFTTITVLVWIGLTIYHNLSTSTLSEDSIVRVTPINPTFDTKTIEQIAKRKVIQVDLAEKVDRQVINPSISPQSSPSSQLRVQDRESTPSQQLTTQ